METMSRSKLYQKCTIGLFIYILTAQMSYHHGNHYNSFVDPHCLTLGAGLGFSSLQGTSVDKDQVKASIKAQEDQQIHNALLAEGRLYSDLELTEKEIEHMVMEVQGQIILLMKCSRNSLVLGNHQLL